MKAIYISLIVFFSAILFAGCVDMDTYPESDIVTSEQKDKIVTDDPAKAEAGVTAIFAQFSTYMPITGTRHNDFGYPSVMLFSDTNGFDYLSSDNGFNWTGNSLDYSDRDYAGNEAKIVWNTMYQIIYVANNVVASIDPDSADPTFQFYLGQALSARSFCYWVLAQLYQFNYVDHKTSPCVPIVTEVNAITAPVEGCKRSTVEEVYTQILTDINKGIDLLTISQKAGEKRRDKRYIDLGVAYGLRARVNLTMENWADAASDAQKALDSGGAVPYSFADVSVPTMSDSNDKSWMWGIVIAETDRIVTSGIVNWPSHMGSLSYGYANFSGGHQINKQLWASIPETDARKGWWLDQDTISKNLNSSYQNYVKLRKYSPYTQVKFAPYNNVVNTSVNASDIPLMRAEEMYLIKAEGEIMSGTGNAVATLENFVKTYRDPEYVCTATGQADVQEEIFRQRRIELWGEGLSWFDIMRLNKPVDRRGAGYANASAIFNIPAGSNILLWRLPEGEIQSNPMLEPSDNNPAAAFPDPVPDIE
ncbi:MAG: RagB/SusD family nutrient uptake outer membrane protein [Bacteroides sp.]|nr:RagB/SusD family nutrient uptake outer membrane protein [Bacteroides sp.]